MKKNGAGGGGGVIRTQFWTDKSTRIFGLRTGRIITNMNNDTDHSVALQASGWKPLKTERKKSKAKIMYKLLNKMGPKSNEKIKKYVAIFL